MAAKESEKRWKNLISSPSFSILVFILFDIALFTTLSSPAPTGRIPSIDGIFFLTEASNILNFGELGWQGYLNS